MTEMTRWVIPSSCRQGMTVIANTTIQEEKIKLQKIICTQNRRADVIVSVAGGGKKYAFYKGDTIENTYTWSHDAHRSKLTQQKGNSEKKKKNQQGVNGSVYIRENLMCSTPLITQIHLLDC